MERIVQLRSEGRGNKAVSVNTYLRCVKAFVKWAAEEKLIGEPVKLNWLKEEQRVLATLSQEQVRRLVKWKPRNEGEKRLQCMIGLLLDTGLRISEALSLTKDRVNLDNLTLIVYGKGQKERVVPMSYEMRRLMYRWLLRHDFPVVFATRDGGKWSQRNALRDCKKFGTLLGITGVRMSFHTMRHTFAINYIRNGGDVFRLQRILGHSTLEMTRRYVNLQTEDLQAVHNRFSPFAQQSSLR